MKISVRDVTAWTDSMVVLSWLVGNPRRFKTFVGNRVTQIISDIPPDRWKHVAGTENPADCASRGLYPSKLIDHQLWWNGPEWLWLDPTNWSNEVLCGARSDITVSTEEVASHVIVEAPESNRTWIFPLDKYSSYERLLRVISWTKRFIKNCRNPNGVKVVKPYVTTMEISNAETTLCLIIQSHQFSIEVELLKAKRPLPKGNRLLPLSPIMDSDGVLRVGGRQRQARISYSKMHPVILHAKHSITRLIIMSEHKRLLHGGPTLMMASLARRFHILCARKVIRAMARECVICKRPLSTKPKPPLFGQLPIERVTPGPVFDHTGLDFARPLLIKYGHVRKPTVVKSYVCVFVSLTVKAVHLELVSDLTTEAFIACLRRFVAHRGHPSVLWSDHGLNFVGANRELKEMYEFQKKQITQIAISEFCSSQRIQWKFIPERSPHFGGIWESAVKSFKNHLKRIIGDVKLTYEETYTVITQIEGCLNSRPLVATGAMDDDGIEVLTPGHFLIGRPLTAIPDPENSYQSMSLLKRWHLCQLLTHHFWKRWLLEYLSTLQKIYKWQYPTKGVVPGDVVLIIEKGIVPMKWPMARIIKTYPGEDGVTRVVDIKTAKGIYRRPVHKLAPLISMENESHSN